MSKVWCETSTNHLRSLSTEAAGELDVFALDGDLKMSAGYGVRMLKGLTRLAWIAQRLVSSNNDTKYASTDSWRAPGGISRLVNQRELEDKPIADD